MEARLAGVRPVRGGALRIALGRRVQLAYLGERRRIPGFPERTVQLFEELPVSRVAPETVDLGEVAVGDSVEGEIAINTRNHYTLEVADDATLNISVSDPDQALDTVLRVLDTEGNLLAENDDIELGVRINSAVEGVAVKAGDTLVIEVATYDDSAEGAYTLTIEAE